MGCGYAFVTAISGDAEHPGETTAFRAMVWNCSFIDAFQSASLASGDWDFGGLGISSQALAR
jgi:hypothetical protein